MHPDPPKAREPRGRPGRSEHAEAFAALTDGHLQHPVHLFIRVIRREAQLVKTGRARGKQLAQTARNTGTGWKWDPHDSTHWALRYLPRVCGWQRAMGRSGNNLERGTKGGKTSRRQLGGACRELKEAGELLLRQTGNHGPKPPHDLAGRAQAGVAPGCRLGFGPEGKEPDTLQQGCAPVTIL